MTDKKIKNSQDTLIHDSPVNNSSEDRFQRYPFAQYIANAVISRSDPSSLVIGIYGAWGEGKTSVMNFIECELKNHSQIVCVKFNPWMFHNENNLIINFFQTLAKSLNKSLTTNKEKIGKFLETYLRFIVPQSLPLPFFFSPREFVAVLGKKMSSVTLDELRDRIQKILNENEKRVVILIDDIDRLDKSEIQALFKLVKLTADFDYTAYILALDEKMVAAALNEKYSSVGSKTGRNFLEKIIQVPLTLPKADEFSLRKLCINGINLALSNAQINLTEDQVKEFVRNFDGFLYRLNTPRICKRYINAISFALPILKGELNPVDLMLMEGIRILYTNIYEAIKSNHEIFIGSDEIFPNNNRTEEIKSFIDKIIKGISKEEASKITDLLKHLFPKISDSSYRKEWDLEQRIASKEYFHRYFTKGVPEGDISDKKISEFIKSLSSKEIEQTVDSFRNFVNQKNAEIVIFKLRNQKERLSEETSIKLAQVIAVCGDIFPDTNSMTSLLTVRMLANDFINQLLFNLPKGEKMISTAKNVLLIADPITFAAQCFQWMKTPENIPKDERIITEEEEKNLGKIFAQRISEEAKKDILYLKYRYESLLLFWNWAHWLGHAETSDYLINSFNENEKNVFEFLKIFFPTLWKKVSGSPQVINTESGDFDNISKCFDPQIIYNKLKRYYGDELDNAKNIVVNTDESVEKKLAFQFAIIFHQVEEEKNNNNKKNGSQKLN